MKTAIKLNELRNELREQVEECWTKADSAIRRGDLENHKWYSDAAGRVAERLADATEEYDLLVG